MICPRCGSSLPAGAGRCTACGAALAQASVATGLVQIDTTGLPPGASFGASSGGFSGGTGDAATGGATADAVTGGTTGLDSPSKAAGGPLKVGQSFGPRYHIIKLLGVGGMGAVYQAWDAELSVAVALKVIRVDRREHSASAELERRFKNELLLARQVTHKNVVRIHDLGEIDGIKYITMPYVQGDDLATVLRRDGKLAVARALNLARQIASGLEAAHEAGVVHRDLKPPNIMIGADDQALIMDFGISASTSEAASGGVIGTLEYMAPEQATGGVVDARADIYAFGLIVYEMLTGPRPAPTGAPQSRIDAMKQRFEAGIPSVRTLDESIPEPLDALVTRCLDRDPAARYQTITELAAALNRLDDHGELLPIRRVVGMKAVTAASFAGLLLLAATWWFARGPGVPVRHETVSVLIADFVNRTGDPVLTGTIEQSLGIALGAASFIETYPRQDAQRIAAALKAGSTLDDATARMVSRREGIKVILTGSIEPSGSRYTLTVKAEDPATGKVLATATDRASSKDDVLKGVGALASKMRSALGETPSESAKLAAVETFTAGSLEAARDFSTAQDLALQGKDEDAIDYCKRALEKDPQFGRAYVSWAVSAYKLGRRDESAEAYKKAFALMDRMTDREKYRTFGVYDLQIAKNYPKALKDFTTLLEKYPADRAGLNNVALANFYLRDFPKALEGGRRAVEQYPNSQQFRNNYALYAMYAGDFETAAKEARRTLEQNPNLAKAYLELAMAALARGDIAGANDAYERMSHIGNLGAALAAAGKADIALYSGRPAEARQILEAQIPVDKAARNIDALAAKYVALGEAYAIEKNVGRSLEAAQQALAVSRDVNVAAAAARVMVRAGKMADAKAIVDRLGQELEAEPRAYAKVIEGEIALEQRRTADAVKAFGEAQGILDLWLARFDLGRAYEEAGHHAEALAELDRAQKRRGEATALFFDDWPTFRHLATLPYWLARAAEGLLGMTEPVAAQYKVFLGLRPPTAKDPLAADARRRLGQ
jgi:tetratricopeptide (TPR) repeat protein